MRNNIASFEKSFIILVTICAKLNVEFIFSLNFAQNITYLLLVFSEEAILFLIYLLADEANYVNTSRFFSENSIYSLLYYKGK